MMIRRFLVAFLLAAMTASALAAVSIKRVKIFNANPAAPAVDIYILQEGFMVKSLMNIPYKGATEWFYLPDVDYSFRITLAGSTDPILTSVAASFSSFSNVAFFYDRGGGELTVNGFNEDITTIPIGKARITSNHLALGFDRIDFGTGNETTNLGSNVGYPFSTEPVYVDPGTVIVGVRPAGNIRDPLVSLNVTLEARKHYLVVAFGDNSLQDLVAYELTDYSINARLAFVHGIPQNNLTVNVGTEQVGIPSRTLFRKIQYKGITDYKNIAAGRYTLNVNVGENTVISVTAFFGGFSESTLYATMGTDGPVGILLLDDNTAPVNSTTRLRVLHGAGAAPSVDFLSGSNTIVSNITYGFASDYLPLSAGSYSLCQGHWH